MIDIIKTEQNVEWKYKNKKIIISKDKIDDARYFVDSDIIIIIYEEEDNFYPEMSVYSIDGMEKSKVNSTDELGILRFSNQSGIRNPVIGWAKEKDDYIDYYFSVDVENKELIKYGRAY